MKKIFIDETASVGDEILVGGDLFFHLNNVLRVRKGEHFNIGAANGEFVGNVCSVGKREISFLIESERVREIKNNNRITVFFALLKGDKNEIVVQKCTELGVDRMVPVVTKNCVVKSLEDKKIARLRTIALEAAMQCDRERVPEIMDAVDVSGVNGLTGDGAYKLVSIITDSMNSGSADLILSAAGHDDVVFFVGPEGDFTPDEKKWLVDSGWIPIRVSDNVLRSETAVIATASILCYAVRGSKW